MSFTPGSFVKVLDSRGVFAHGEIVVVTGYTDGDRTFVRKGSDHTDESARGRWFPNLYLEAVEAPTPAPVEENADLLAFKETVRVAALDAASRTGVSGVPDFLRSIGIDPDVPLVPAAKPQETLTVVLHVKYDVDTLYPATDVHTFLEAHLAGLPVEIAGSRYGAHTTLG